MGDDLLGIGKAASSISQPLQDFLSKLLGPASEEAGELFADRIRYFRWKNSLHILEQANNVLKAKGIMPQRIPLTTLVPILEGASLEEDDDNLRKKWINLIAKAASGERIHSRYPEILKQLSSLDALILDELFEIEQSAISKRDNPLEKYFSNQKNYTYGVYAGAVTQFLVEDKNEEVGYIEVSESIFCLSKLHLISSFLIEEPGAIVGMPLTVLGKAFMNTVKMAD